MADLTRSSISVSATPAEVMAVIADFAAYPEWIRFLRGVEVVETDATGRGTVVRFVLDAGVVADDYTLAYQWADDEVSWHLVSATSIKAMDAATTWSRLEPVPTLATRYRLTSTCRCSGRSSARQSRS